jgi:PAS domain S-box-containing protein
MRILIADDHELVRRGMRSVLSKRPDIEICGEAVDGSDAVKQCRELRPEIVLMDINMPRLNGLDAIREMRQAVPQVNIVVVTQHDTSEMMRQALIAGAKGYVLKSSISESLIAAIDTVSRGQPFFDSGFSAAEDKNLQTREILRRAETVERALRESEERFRLTFEQAAVGIAHVAPDGTMLRANQRLCEIVGYAPEELSKLKFQDITDPADLDADLAQLRKMLAGEIDQYVMEKRYVRKNGSVVWASLTVSAVRDAQQNVNYFVSVVQDISARKEEEQSKALLAAIVDSSDDAIVSKNLDGLITSWNKGAERLFGYTAEEAVGQNIKLVIPRERHKEEDEILARLRRGERLDHFETVRVRKDGARLDISLTISPVKDSTGRIVGASKVARDITGRKRTEAALADAARQQRTLYRLADGLHRAESMEDIYNAALDTMAAALPCDRSAILLCDKGGPMRFVAWRELSEPYRSIVAGHSIWKPDQNEPYPICIANIDASDLPESLRAAVKREGIRAAGFFPLVSNRKLIGKFMAYYNAPHAFDEREVEVSVTIARSLAYAIERKRGEDALRRSEEQLRALTETLEQQVRVRTTELEMRNVEVTSQSEQLRDLSARLLQAQDYERRRIARELHDSAGQILTGLGLNLASIAKYAPDNLPHVSGAIEHSQELVAELTQEIRTMSYLLHPPLLEETGLREAILWYVHGLRDRSALQTTVDITADLPRLSPEAELVIFRVVQETLTNIHRHSGSKTAHIRVARDEAAVLVEIRDEGTGIPEHKLKDIQSRGSGVGIRGMRERVRLLHGNMMIESNSGGTTVSVTFPADQVIRSKEKEQGDALPRLAAESTNRSGKRVLVADDNPLVRRAVCGLFLDQEHWRVCGEAGTGTDAIAKARELQPDLVLLDINLPDMSGIQVIRAIRSETPDVTILVMSHHDPGLFLAGVQEAGADGFLDKSRIGSELPQSLKSIEEKKHFAASAGPTNVSKG